MADRRSSISLGTIIKNVSRFIPHPWIFTKLATLQVEKLLLKRFTPDPGNGKARRIRQLSFRVTDRCNLRCHTCGQWGDTGYLHQMGLKQLVQNEVTPERYIEIMNDLVSHGHRPIIYFWGGEPMLYKGTLRLIKAATNLGLPASIATNGTHIASAANGLVDAQLFLMQISIDGHNAETHNSLRPSVGKGDNFSDINDGLDAVNMARRQRKSGLPLIASLTVISEANANHLVDIYEAFKNKVDLFVFYLSWWITPERADLHDRDFERRFGFIPKMHRGWLGKWQIKDYQGLNIQLEELLARSSPVSATPVTIIPPVTGVKNLSRYYTDHASRFGFDQCISIYQAVEVDSNGDISPCRDYRDYIVGNIKDNTISELWNSGLYCYFRKSLSSDGLMPVCSRCCGLMGY